MNLLSKVTFVLAMTVSVASFAKVRIKLVDRDNKPVVGAPVMAIVDGTRITTNSRGGLPIPGRHNYIFGGKNYFTDKNGVISSEPHEDLGEFTGGLTGKRKSVGYGPGVYSKGDSFTSGMGLDGATCVAVTGADQFDEEQNYDLKVGSVNLSWKVSADVDVVCKFKERTAQDVLDQAKQFLDVAAGNGADVPRVP